MREQQNDKSCQSQAFILKKRLIINHLTRMITLIWVAVINFAIGISQGIRQNCDRQRFCVTMAEAEIRAEVGLCVILPCSFTTDNSIRPQSAVWFKCSSTRFKCSNIIFHSKDNSKAQHEFIGRVALLDPDLSHNNCSIIINDLAKSDSGSYQFRVNGMRFGQKDGFTFSMKTTVSVQDLSQKPTVMIPALTEGQQTALTCTAPGHCSGSDPTFTWTWRRQQTPFTVENNKSLTAITQTHISTLSFSPSAGHHRSEISCAVIFRDDITTEETAILNVTYVKKLKITGNKNVMEGEDLNLICSVESYPPSLITWIQLESNQNLPNETNTIQLNDTGTDTANDTRKVTLVINNTTVEDSGQYICKAKHLNKTLTEQINVTVMYLREPVLTGNTTVEEGDALNLTCRVESLPPSLITWTKPNKNLQSKTKSKLLSNTGMSTLLIPHLMAQDSGWYSCTANYLNTTQTIHAYVTVFSLPKILAGSGCVLQSEVLTCVCATQGIPLPAIKWPLLEKCTEYSVVSTVTNYTVNATLMVSVKDFSNSTTECVSSNEYGNAKENLTTIMKELETKEEQINESFVVTWPEVIIAFLIGALLSASLCCLIKLCHRKKMKNSRNLTDNLEMEASLQEPLINAGQSLEHGLNFLNQVDPSETGSMGTSPLDFDGDPKEVEYANIDFSLLKRKSPTNTVKKESTKTEYAEIKKEQKEMRQDSYGEQAQVEWTSEENKETNLCLAEDQSCDDAVYSNVKDTMGEI